MSILHLSRGGFCAIANIRTIILGALAQSFDVMMFSYGACCEGLSVSAMKPDKSSCGLVFSTDGGRMCPACRNPIERCVCRRKSPGSVSDGVVRVSRQTKGRNGKNVTVIRGLALTDAALVLLGKEIKTACGSGGTVKDGVIEVQGDHCDRIIEILKPRFGNVKRAGG